MLLMIELQMLDVMFLLLNSRQLLLYESFWHYLPCVILLYLKEMTRPVKSFTRLQVLVRLLMYWENLP